jgi:hypothetical protein
MGMLKSGQIVTRAIAGMSITDFPDIKTKGRSPSSE